MIRSGGPKGAALGRLHVEKNFALRVCAGVLIIVA